jgi:hypothetical protein
MTSDFWKRKTRVSQRSQRVQLLKWEEIPESLFEVFDSSLRRPE